MYEMQFNSFENERNDRSDRGSDLFSSVMNGSENIAATYWNQSNGTEADAMMERNFGRLTLVENVSNEQQEQKLATKVVDGETVDVVRQPDGSVAHIYPKNGEEQKVVYYKNLDASDKRRPERIETNYDPGHPEGQYRKIEYTNAAQHGGIKTIRQFEGRDDGKTTETAYEKTVDGLTRVVEYDSDKNEKGLQQERFFDPKVTGGLREERTFEPEKNGGVAKERVVNGRTLRYDANGKLIPDPDRDTKPMLKPVIKNTNDDDIELDE